MKLDTNDINMLRFLLISSFLVAAFGQAYPPKITDECDPCRLLEDGQELSEGCKETNPIVAQIIARDSSCGREWDPFCLVEYNDCYSQACGLERQNLIDDIASTGGPEGRPINRTQIINNCPPTFAPSHDPSSSPSASPSVSPSASPSASPSSSPSVSPSASPSNAPSASPSESPSASPSISPSAHPSVSPSRSPSSSPSESPTDFPSPSPSESPSGSFFPSSAPSHSPTKSKMPSNAPSSSPSESPSAKPSASPSSQPSSKPSLRRSESPSESPSSSPSLRPSATPSASPSKAPSSSPSLRPSSTPSMSPTDYPTVNPECTGRPWVITFKYIGGNCSQSDNLQTNQKFSCTDSNDGPPRRNGVESYITAVPRGGTGNYFSGYVGVGEQYTLNANKHYDKLAADMTITIFEERGGLPLQIVNMHLSCSQPLVLMDKYGANQVLQFMETSGRVIKNRQVDIERNEMYARFADSF